MSRELLQQALDALEFPHDSEWSNKAKAIEALQHALAQPDHNHLSDAMSVLADVNADLIAEAKLAQPEQDAGKCGCGANLYIDENGKPCSKAQPEPQVCCGDYEKCMKACTPRGRWLGEKESRKLWWVGLTDDELWDNFYRVVESKLKKKNMS
jgi:hypothetical protein